MKQDRLQSEKSKIIKTVILPAIQRFIPLEPDILAKLDDGLLEISNYRLFTQNEIFAHDDYSRAGKIWYLVRGFAKSFYSPIGTEENVITNIWQRHNVLISIGHESSIQEPLENYRMLVDGYMLYADYKQVFELFKEKPGLNKLFELMIADRNENTIRYHTWKQMKTKDMVYAFLDYYPGIHHYDQSIIASYLKLSRGTYNKYFVKYKAERGLH